MLDLFTVLQSVYLKKKRSKMPIYRAWDVKQETRKAVAAGSFEEFAKADELFCCLISEIQSDMYSERLQRGYGTIIFSLTDLFKGYNTSYSDFCFILRVKSLPFCYKNTKRCLCTWYFRPTLVLGILGGGGGGYVFQTRIGKGGIIFTSKFFWGGFSFETLHFFENHRPP